MPTARLAEESDLSALLDLFRASEVSAAAAPLERAEDIWRQTMSRDDLAVFVSAVESRIVASCMLITAPNLLRAPVVGNRAAIGATRAAAFEFAFARRAAAR